MKLLVLAKSIHSAVVKSFEITAAWVVRFFRLGNQGDVLASYVFFLVFSAIEIGAWACIALEAQWAEAFLDSLSLSSTSKTFFSLGHDLFVISSMIHLQTKFSDGPIGITFREVGRFLGSRLRRLSDKD